MVLMRGVVRRCVDSSCSVRVCREVLLRGGWSERLVSFCLVSSICPDPWERVPNSR